MTISTTKQCRQVAEIGEEVGLELGQQFVSNFQDAYPAETPYYMIGRKIIDQILSQPGCVGIKFYRALNEYGNDTLVYVGMDSKGINIIEIISVDAKGDLQKTNAIIADRSAPPPPPAPNTPPPMNPTKPGKNLSADDFEWVID